MAYTPVSAVSVDLTPPMDAGPVGFNQPSTIAPQRPPSPSAQSQRSVSIPHHLGLPYLQQRNSSVSSLMDAVVGSSPNPNTNSSSSTTTSGQGQGQGRMNAPPQLRNPLSPVSPPGRWDLSSSGFPSSTGSGSNGNASPADFGFVKVNETAGEWDKLSDIHEVRGGSGNGEAVKELQEKVEKRRSQLPQLESQLAALEAQIKAAEERLARAQGTPDAGGAQAQAQA